MNEKKFADWHLQKSDLHENKHRVFFHEREVWFASVGSNIGFEQDGKGHEFLRPVVIIKKFNNEVCWCVPTTRKHKNKNYYFEFCYSENQTTYAILSQLRLIDCKRLGYKIGVMSKKEFTQIKIRLISFLE